MSYQIYSGVHMGHFIPGVLTNIKVTGEYQGNVFDRELTLLHNSGQTLKIFDGVYGLGEYLQEGEVYEFILAAAVVTHISNSPIAEDSEKFLYWQGIIVDPSWIPLSVDYRLSDPDLYRDSYGNQRYWVIVKTSLGNLLMSENEIKQQTKRSPNKGDLLYWKFMRLDLFAVVA